MSQQDDNDSALLAIQERDDELRQIVAQAEELGKLREALDGTRARADLAESRAKRSGRLGSVKKVVQRKTNVDIQYREMKPEDLKAPEDMGKLIPQSLRDLRKSSS